LRRIVRLYIIAGEPSGDLLAAGLMRALRAAAPALQARGVGGAAMIAAGLDASLRIEDIAVHGLVDVVKNLPRLAQAVSQTAHDCAAFAPDALVLVDAPDFTHRVARRVRALAPQIPIIDYVSPSVWAWRPGRAKKMRAYVDQVLALFPFEPEAHARLNGPPCVFVGHPLIEHLGDLRPSAAEAAARAADPPLWILMPGSRASEIARHMPIFGQALHLAAQRAPNPRVVLPAVPHLEATISEEIRSWPYKPEVIVEPQAKFAAFRAARAALAASGTATLELGLAGVPSVVAYKVSPLEERLKFLVNVPSVVLSNLILGENVVPEFLHDACTAKNLADALVAVARDGPERRAQTYSLERLPSLLAPASDLAPSVAAATEVIATIRFRRA
jgi:lipid-A-disaccharide synthase